MTWLTVGERRGLWAVSPILYRKTKEWLEWVLLPEVFFLFFNKESCLWYSKIFQSYQETIVLKVNLDKSLLLSKFRSFLLSKPCRKPLTTKLWNEVWAYSSWRTRDCKLLPEMMRRIKLVGCSRHLIFTEVSGFHSFKADSLTSFGVYSSRHASC